MTSHPPLQDTARAGPYRLPPDREAGLLASAASLGLQHLIYRPEGNQDIRTWLAGLGQTLGFPEHFGANFDALYDCLTDTEILPQPGLLLILGGLTSLGDAVDILIAIFQAASDEWRDHERPLWVLFDAPNLDLDPLPKA
ncbi:barstar family protein [Azovibrio restrictus]|uniref:barstar family protein n=1 Tax=Azovibrio restrictus TaxID=146938 RepID=UPI0026EA2084|nr:barstar family protein [Azovibrio restrictus]MDD3483228.1 barstar family protein [Azovibrio restrictus]